MATTTGASPSATQCPKCHQGDVRTVSQTEYFVDFRCPSCDAVWSEPERRRGKRVYEVHAPAAIGIDPDGEPPANSPSR